MIIRMMKLDERIKTNNMTGRNEIMKEKRDNAW